MLLVETILTGREVSPFVLIVTVENTLVYPRTYFLLERNNPIGSM